MSVGESDQRRSHERLTFGGKPPAEERLTLADLGRILGAVGFLLAVTLFMTLFDR
jgi:hypothetical protein